MSSVTEFIPTPRTTPSSAIVHYLKIEDTKGQELYKQFLNSDQELQATFNKLKTSKDGYTPFFCTVFPVYCDSASRFAKSFFIPQTQATVSPIENRIASIAIKIFTLIWDVVTLPLRAITAIPYLIHQKFLNTEKEHKIIELIHNNSLAAYALNEGKVVIRAITESFDEIQTGSMRGHRVFKLDGTIYEKATDVYIKSSLLCEHQTKGGNELKELKGVFNETIQERYSALQKFKSDCCSKNS